MARIIGHLDMDAFFASVEERDHEWLKGLPVVVGADPLEGKGRGVVSTANYKAREYGIRSAMAISQAWRLSQRAKLSGKPSVIFVAPNMEHYREVSENIVSIVRNYVETIEQAGLDEVYLDLSFTGSYAKARKLCLALKKEIKDREKLTCSIGLGPNKLVAKIASDFQKPDGFTVVRRREVRSFLSPLPIRALPGVGPKTEYFFVQKGVKTIKDLQELSKYELINRFGKWGEDLYKKARGVDNSLLLQEKEVKSIGQQETFPKDTADSKAIFEKLKTICASIIDRANERGFSGFRTVVVTVRFADFETKSSSRTFKDPVFSENILLFEAMRLLVPFLDSRKNPIKRAIRLIGVRIEKLS